MILPMRAEKRFIPESALSIIGDLAVSLPQTVKATPQTADLFITAAKQTFTDYVVVTIPHRGLDTKGNLNPALPASFRFLINPQTAQVSRNMEDAQTFARGGWQFGVWGEGLISVSLTGHTPGQYWTYGLTDGYSYFAESWRNLEQLTMVFENNGYFFEGEEVNEGPLAPGYARRRIKKHQDVILTVGNFIWYGMFQDFSYTLDAEHPFRAEFHLSFLSWKERFRPSSPYFNSLPTNIQRGHSYGAYAYAASEQPTTSAGQNNSLPLGTTNPTLSTVFTGVTGTPPSPNVNVSSPAMIAASFANYLPSPIQPQASSVNFNPMTPASWLKIAGPTGN